MSVRERCWWGWGYADGHPDDASVGAMAPHVEGLLGLPVLEPIGPPAIEAVAAALPAPRVPLPDGLAGIVSDDPVQRVHHSHGKSFRDDARGLRGQIDAPPDLVARPRDEGDVERVLEWAAGARVAVIPYGGGTSVCGGVEAAELGSGVEGALSLDLGALDRVIEVDPVSRAARIEAGANGPRLEAQLKEQGLTMRFFPQSFELSTLGGWIATRAGGHFATVWTHVDDVVESIRALTPSGSWESRRLPGSGAGPSPDRMLLGSEGTLGVITSAWVRVQPRPEHRASRAVRFPAEGTGADAEQAAFLRGAEAVRALSQSGLHPANCRLVDALEARQTGATDPADPPAALLVLGFESTDHPVDAALDRALEIARDHGGVPDAPRASSGGGESAVDAWKEAFIAMPYLRDTLLRLGILADTFETAMTWERFPAFHAAVMGATREAVGEPCRVSCRFTHVYPDGPAPYYTVMAPVARGDELERWAAMKDAASRAIVEAGGTITHHHAVGRDHRPYYEAQRPDVFAAALRGAKEAVDPGGIMNPGVLLPAR